MSSLFDQLDETELSIVATLVGAKGNNAGFRINMRAIEPLPEPFTMGQACSAYGKHLMLKFGSFEEYFTLVE